MAYVIDSGDSSSSDDDDDDSKSDCGSEQSASQVSALGTLRLFFFNLLLFSSSFLLHFSQQQYYGFLDCALYFLWFGLSLFCHLYAWTIMFEYYLYCVGRLDDHYFVNFVQIVGEGSEPAGVLFHPFVDTCLQKIGDWEQYLMKLLVMRTTCCWSFFFFFIYI